MIISAHMITHQCITLDFCFEATIRSMLDFCDDIYINDGKSTDGTLDVLYSLQNEYGKDRVKIFERHWRHDRQMWTEEKNFILDKVPIDAYIFCIDADEVIHEEDMSYIKEMVADEIPSIAFRTIHFYGRPTHYIEGPHWYKQHTRLWHRATGIRIVHKKGGCADDVLWPNGAPAHLFNYKLCKARIFHYGNCRDPKALGRKAKKADDLYQNSNDYLDETIADPRSFTYLFDKVPVIKFSGTHPKYVKDWYEQHKDQPTSYDAGDGQFNRLWCFEGVK